MVYNDNFNGYIWLFSKNIFFLTDESFKYTQDDIDNISIINLHNICYTNTRKRKRLVNGSVDGLLFHYYIIQVYKAMYDFNRGKV